MPKAFKHTGVLMMLAVVALGLIGAGYALWYEELTLNANVTTGTFNVDWSVDPTTGTPPQNGTGVVCLFTAAGDCVTADGYHAPGVAPIPAGKPAPTCLASLGTSNTTADDSNASGTTNGGSNNVLNLAVTGAYPWTGCKFTIDVDNTGTVPAHFYIEPHSNDTSPPLANSPFIGFAAVAHDPTDANSAALCPNIGVVPAAGLEVQGAQLHSGPANEILCDVFVYLKETDAAGNTVGEGLGPGGPGASDTTLHFSWEMVAHQWNEAVSAANHPN